MKKTVLNIQLFNYQKEHFFYPLFNANTVIEKISCCKTGQPMYQKRTIVKLYHNAFY